MAAAVCAPLSLKVEGQALLGPAKINIVCADNPPQSLIALREAIRRTIELEARSRTTWPCRRCPATARPCASSCPAR